jgi:uncharacterized protein
MSPKKFEEVTRRLAESAASRANGGGAAANLLTVRQQIDAIARGELQAALECAHPDIELEIFAPPEFPWIRRAVGVEALTAAIRQNFASIDDQRPTIHNVVTEHDLVVLFGEERGLIRETGVAYHMQFVHRFTFVDGRLKSIRIVAAKAA